MTTLNIQKENMKIYKYIKHPDINEPIKLPIEHSKIINNLIIYERIEKIQKIIFDFDNFIKKNEKILKEALGVNKEVSDFCDKLFDIIKDDIKNKKMNNNIVITNDFGINNIEIIYSNIQSNNIASIIKEDNNDIILKIYNINVKNLLSLLNHEFLHVYSDFKGMNKVDYYDNLIHLTNNYGFDDGYSGRLIHILYFFTEHEMNSNIQELWKEIKNNNVKTIDDFNNYIKNHEFYTYLKYVENINLYHFWERIKNENRTGIFIKSFDIKDVNTWLIKNEKKLKSKTDKFKRRIFKLRDLLSQKDV